MTAQPYSPQQPPEDLVRYCPECGLVGDPRAPSLDCCPDGSRAYRVPHQFAQACRDAFVKAYLISAPTQQQAGEPSEHELSTTQGQADAHLRALLRYTENFYCSAIEHGMKAGPTANAIAHVERAGKAMHQIIHAQARMLTHARTQPPACKNDSNEFSRIIS